MQEKHFGPIWFIPGENRGKYPACHSVYVAEAGVLIDPASDRQRLKQLRDESGVNEVWLTHWHEDHFTHLDLFEDVPLKCAAADAPMLADIEAFLDGYGLKAGEHREAFKAMVLEHFHFQSRVPTETLTAGQVIDLGPVSAEVIHTPGHTPGHLAFFFQEPAVLFLGDYDLTPFGPWYGDRLSSIGETMASIRRLREVPAAIWLTGHGEGVFEQRSDLGWERYLAVIGERERKLLNFLQQPRTMDEIVQAWMVFRKPREPVEFYAFGEAAIMGKHLRQLLEGGIVSKSGKLFRLNANPQVDQKRRNACLKPR
jgi:glyoxylase-like metal-dependent hydrolase (beta-lactamase superfamily II)